MNQAWTYLSGHIANGATPEEADARGLDQWLHEHPYFAGLQYMKAFQATIMDRPDAMSERARAALYFPNPHWFKTLLDDRDTVIPEEAIAQVSQTPEPEAEPKPEPAVPPESGGAELPASPVPEPAESEATADTGLAFEPLHTVDYFASQGIRYNPDTGKDPLSLKLKSFTEWLKSMKRIHRDKAEEKGEEDPELSEFAESSNQTLEVYTEAMAEVYLKQGLREKAMEAYQKLSLLDPSKSAYFTLRIKEIKEN
jgi:hypothetical protein